MARNEGAVKYGVTRSIIVNCSACQFRSPGTTRGYTVAARPEKSPRNSIRSPGKFSDRRDRFLRSWRSRRRDAPKLVDSPLLAVGACPS